MCVSPVRRRWILPSVGLHRGRTRRCTPGPVVTVTQSDHVIPPTQGRPSPRPRRGRLRTGGRPGRRGSRLLPGEVTGGSRRWTTRRLTRRGNTTTSTGGRSSTLKPERTKNTRHRVTTVSVRDGYSVTPSSTVSTTASWTSRTTTPVGPSVKDTTRAWFPSSGVDSVTTENEREGSSVRQGSNWTVSSSVRVLFFSDLLKKFSTSPRVTNDCISWTRFTLQVSPLSPVFQDTTRQSPNLLLFGFIFIVSVRFCSIYVGTDWVNSCPSSFSVNTLVFLCSWSIYYH